ncbi:MAG: helix-turn-helix domain-containing protein [bacterium]
MTEEILPNGVYTTEEAEKLLKISNSTMKRMLKVGLIRANKVGKQYRILGLELLRLVSPEVEHKAVDVYLKVKKKVLEKTSDW